MEEMRRRRFLTGALSCAAISPTAGRQAGPPGCSVSRGRRYGFHGALAQKLSEHLGKPIVVDNRGGAGGTIGAEVVASPPPDGYTLLFSTMGVLAINPSLYEKLRYDPLKDLTSSRKFATVQN